MVIVTGTKRSGTSLWMQILIQGGLSHIGEAFPSVWSQSISGANPKGFYESRLRTGVYYATNPDPKTGNYLRPKETRKHAVKVFIPGVIRSDIAFLHRVNASMRDWRAYSRSLAKLYAQEDEWLRNNPNKGESPQDAVDRANRLRSPLPAPVEWFLENYELVRDFAARRYPINFVSYEALLADPEPLVNKVLDWVGEGDLEAAMGAIDTTLNRSSSPDRVPEEADLKDAHRRVFDDLYGAIHERGQLPQSLLPDLNDTWLALQEEFGSLSRERGREEAVSVDE